MLAAPPLQTSDGQAIVRIVKNARARLALERSTIA
jgi:hypothetical protein